MLLCCCYMTVLRCCRAAVLSYRQRFLPGLPPNVDLQSRYRWLRKCRQMVALSFPSLPFPCWLTIPLLPSQLFLGRGIKPLDPFVFDLERLYKVTPAPQHRSITVCCAAATGR